MLGNRNTANHKHDVELKTIRPFRLHKSMDIKSEIVGNFKQGLKAKPGLFKMVFVDSGEYIVEKNHSKKANLKPGDKVRKLINLGEGTSKVERQGKWYEFGVGEITLTTITPTNIEQ